MKEEETTQGQPEMEKRGREEERRDGKRGSESEKGRERKRGKEMIHKRTIGGWPWSTLVFFHIVRLCGVSHTGQR